MSECVSIKQISDALKNLSDAGYELRDMIATVTPEVAEQLGYVDGAVVTLAHGSLTIRVEDSIDSEKSEASK